MNIQINTDANISGRDAVAQRVEEKLEGVFARFADQITTIEVHLSDENSASKSGEIDKRCLIEARLEGLEPLSVSDQASAVEQAISGAADKMVSLLESELGKLGEH